MADSVFVKGFRTQAAYFVENTFGTYNISNTKARRIGGKVKGVNWTVRQNILQTGSIGQGRNYTQQLFGQYDASASLNFEVCDFSFLRFAVGDIVRYGTGITEAAPYAILEAELSGTDAPAIAADTSSNAFTGIRVRPFSMLLYDMENVAGASTMNDNVDMLTGCMISDFTISASVGTPLMCSANIVAKEIQYRRFLAAGETPDFTSATVSTYDYGTADIASTTAPGYGTPVATQTIADYAPLMFYNGTLKTQNKSTGDTTVHTLGQVTSFNYSYNNSLITYRALGDRFIQMPQLGMRRQGLSCNVVFRLPAGSDGIPGTASETSILELIRNYLGYESASTTSGTWGGAPFTSTDILRPAMATTVAGSGAGTGSPQKTTPVEKYLVQLYLSGGNDSTDNNRGATVNVRNAAIEGFGLPIVLENGLIEIPINFSVRGFQYSRVSDGSYNGYVSALTTVGGIAPILTWWF